MKKQAFIFILSILLIFFLILKNDFNIFMQPINFDIEILNDYSFPEVVHECVNTAALYKGIMNCTYVCLEMKENKPTWLLSRV